MIFIAIYSFISCLTATIVFGAFGSGFGFTVYSIATFLQAIVLIRSIIEGFKI